MRIFQVINVRWFNATSWYALYLSKLLKDAGHDVLVLTIEGTQTHAKSLEWGLETYVMDLNTNNPVKLIRLFREMLDLIRALNPDVVNCHRGESFILWGLAKKLTKGFGLVRTRGDQRPPKNNAVNRWLHTSLADAVVATNKTTARHFRDLLGVPNNRLWIILGGVDRDVFGFDPQGRERVRNEFGFAPEDKVIGLLGRFDAVKGQRETIRAVSDLYHERGMKNARLLLIGFETATSQARVEDWIREYDAGDIVSITGEREDVAACISALDIGLVASLWSETIARAALEIMSCQVPLVGARVGVMPDLLPEAALVEPGDVTAMTDILQKAATDDAFLAQIRQEQQDRMRGLTGAEFLNQTLMLYKGLVK